MNNVAVPTGMDNSESHNNDDENSFDGQYEASHPPESNKDNSNSDQELMLNSEESSYQNADHQDQANSEASEEIQVSENDNSDAMNNFLKLLPYFLLAKSATSTSTMGNGNEIDMETGNLASEFLQEKQLLESPALKALHLEYLRTQLVSQLQANYLQQMMPGLSTPMNGHLQSNNNHVDADDSDVTSSENEEPLDLTQKHKVCRMLPNKLQDDKLLRMNARTERGYTIQDLEAALRDIRSGKLGTRRAAVIYGIPRSTLRNKVYKMGKTSSKPPEFVHMSSRQKTWEPDFSTMTQLTARSIGGRNDLQKLTNGIFEVSEKYNGHSSVLMSGSEILEDREVLSREGNQLAFSMDEKGFSRSSRHDSSVASLSYQAYSSAQNPSTSFETYTDGTTAKKTRPKRGKYRNYDREALAKAVQAVQNGEMSVHRAGSYFGVPHSTLEYKVKERHLLRQSKFKGKNAVKTGNKVTPSMPNFRSSRSVASISPPTLSSIESTDTNGLLKAAPDLQRNFSNYFNLSHQIQDSRWNSPVVDLLGAQIRDGDRDESSGNDHLKKEINDPLQKINGPNESLEIKPTSLLNLTKKT